MPGVITPANESNNPPTPPSRIKRLQARLANKVDQYHHQDQHRESGERDPPGLDVVLGLAQELAKLGVGARHPEVEEVQAGQLYDSAREPEREEGNDRC